MKIIKHQSFFAALALVVALGFCSSADAQKRSNFEVLGDADTEKIVPSSFYFAGQSAPTQMRNSAAARVGKDRLVVAGLVDTSGYSTEISGKYEGFFITDSAVRVGDRMLPIGAYGFGFSRNGRLNIFDLSGKQILSTPGRTEPEMKRPRPLQMVAHARGIRFYKGRNFVLISPR
jgi:hypothetical protein